MRAFFTGLIARSGQISIKTTDKKSGRVLVLGAYGLIGSEITRRLKQAGMTPVGVVRNLSKAEQLIPGVDCIEADLSVLTAADDWRPLLKGCVAVVNASGALQTGVRDNLARVQEKSISALICCCEAAGVHTFVQISAPGATQQASTEFMRTKAAADKVLRASKLNWVVFKPGLVLSRNAYGGTALLRALAAFPFVQPLVLGGARIQTISIDDVADAVVAAVESKVPLRRDYDLVEPASHSLTDIVISFRRWMGFRSPRIRLSIPLPIARLLARGADGAGWLGWRSPLRTTALQVLSEHVEGDAAPWEQAAGRTLQSFDETLSAMPATVQEKIYARTQLTLPFVLIALSGFFIISGVVGLTHMRVAEQALTGTAAEPYAAWLVIAGSAMDIILGLGVLYRNWARAAAIGMAVLSSAYLVAGTSLTPQLWADPLGPLAKIIPVIILSIWVAMTLEER